VFYGLVPDPGNARCVVDRNLARNLLPPVMIHEFQHMISYNRHVLLGGGAGEATWLNEGLSHFAEELGGRRLPSALCTGQNCVNQFVRSDVGNAYDYMLDPERYYLIEPGLSYGTLPERGANWLFVRWLAEQAPGDSAIGTAVTRRLLGADSPSGLSLTSQPNVEAAAAAVFEPGASFAGLLAEWHAANYLESRHDIAPIGRLHYRSWDLANAFSQIAFGPYPLRPDSVQDSYHRNGALRGGSGRLVRVLPATRPVAVTLEVERAGLVNPYLGIVRIR
jgi:hypothetical protein